MAAAAVLSVAAGALAAPTLLPADDPPPTVTTTVTVPARVQGKTVHWWAPRAIQNRKNSDARGQTIRRLQQANRSVVELGGHGIARGFLCIHRFEGSWTDPNPPHWGGLQMDRQFMQQYGPVYYQAWGTADNWPPFIQLAVAVEAHLTGRGYGPWPNTRRMCGI